MESGSCSKCCSRLSNAHIRFKTLHQVRGPRKGFLARLKTLRTQQPRGFAALEPPEYYLGAPH
eukprot:3032565-Pyramimonas_sp.AAC.1